MEPRDLRLRKNIATAFRLTYNLCPSLGRILVVRYSWDYVMVFEVRAEDKELTAYQRRFSMKEILTRLNAGGKFYVYVCDV